MGPTSVVRIVENDGLRHASSFLVDGIVNFGVRHHLDHISIFGSYDADIVVSGQSDAVHQTVSTSKTESRLKTYKHNRRIIHA